MDNQLLQALLINIIVPEVAALFRLMHARGLPPPTDAEVLAALQLDSDRVIAIGQAFLNQTKP